MIRILEDAWARILDHVEKGFPHECCGVMGGIAGSEEVSQIFRAENLNTERSRDRYVMNPKDILRAEKKFSGEGQDVLGYYHSHPDHESYFSETDRAHAWPGYCYVVVSVKAGKAGDVTAWKLNEQTQQMEQEKIQIVKGSRQ